MTPLSLGGEADAWSPVVSYVFADSLGSSPVYGASVSYIYPEIQRPSDAHSPLVSYQYPDWVGDEHARSLTGPGVSYFFESGAAGPPVVLNGQVLGFPGLPIAGAKVTVSFFSRSVAEATTFADGTFFTDPLPSSVYALTVAKESYVTSRRVVKLTGETAWQEFQLVALPVLPPLEDADEPPGAGLAPKVTSGQLKVFDGTEFVSLGDPGGNVDSSRMSVVLTHGWVPPETELSTGGIHAWPTDFAKEMHRQGYDAIANMLAWDWGEAAFQWLPPESVTGEQGVGLGATLWAALGADYAHEIHFLGHSLGTLVNAFAADYLHGNPRGHTEAGEDVPSSSGKHWDPKRTHMTLFDEAEAGRLLEKGPELVFAAYGTHAFPPLAALIAGGVVVDVATGWKSPVPEQAAWVDNYVAAFGLYKANAVNIYLQQGLARSEGSLFEALAQAHGYPMQWYVKTIAEPEVTDFLGFQQSSEVAKAHPEITAAFPSDEVLGRVGSLYLQVDSADGKGMTLELVPDDQKFEKYLGKVAPPVAGYAVGEAGAAIGNGLKKVGSVIVETTESVAVDLYAAAESVWEGTVVKCVDLVSSFNLMLVLQTTETPILAARRTHDAGPTEPSNTPAGVWLPVVIPEDAVALAFDLQVRGEPKSDQVICGLNGTNVFGLPARFLREDERATSSLIEVTAYAGKTNALFFGVQGGSSTNCVVTVDRIRFYAATRPTIQVAPITGGCRLAWNTKAFGYVLETTPTLSPAGWVTVTNSPVIVGDRYVVTNLVDATSRFFRLRQE